ncbi:MAG: hypothetical protein HY591_05935, partial [Candidatus Omnitrophica bacterium]|nr:hypothetical protein [Candidatus Omnitrophota bacterium]
YSEAVPAGGGKELSRKHRILVANKMDLPEAKKNLTRFKRKVTKDIFPVSAKEGEGLEKVMAAIRENLGTRT